MPMKTKMKTKLPCNFIVVSFCSPSLDDSVKRDKKKKKKDISIGFIIGIKDGRIHSEKERLASADRWLLRKNFDHSATAFRLMTRPEDQSRAFEDVFTTITKTKCHCHLLIGMQFLLESHSRPSISSRVRHLLYPCH